MLGRCCASPTTPACGCGTSPPWSASPSAAPTASSPTSSRAGYVVKDKDGRRNRYRIQAHLPLRDPITQERTIGEMLDLLVGVNAHRNTHNQDRTHHG